MKRGFNLGRKLRNSALKTLHKRIIVGRKKLKEKGSKETEGNIKKLKLQRGLPLLYPTFADEEESSRRLGLLRMTFTFVPRSPFYHELSSHK